MLARSKDRGGRTYVTLVTFYSEMALHVKSRFRQDVRTVCAVFSSLEKIIEILLDPWYNRVVYPPQTCRIADPNQMSDLGGGQLFL